MKNKKPATTVNAALRHDPRMGVQPRVEDEFAWFSPWDKPLHIEGLGWKQNGGVFRRMPSAAEFSLPAAVDDLAWHTAGVQVRFRTNSPQIALRVKLRGVHSMDHMPATGQCGFDAYIGDIGSTAFAGVTRFSRDADEYLLTLCRFTSAEMRTVTINFPLYQGVEKAEIGIKSGSQVTAAPRRAWRRPVVIYGTSITQGGCASRPGMAYTNILSRRIDCEFVNLGFSGSGRGEPEVAQAIATLPAPALFVMDYDANAGGLDNMRKTFMPFLAALRKRWPNTTILVVSKIRYAQEALDEKAQQARIDQRDFQRKSVARLRRTGDKAVFFLDGGRLLGDDFNECCVDGVHPTDLGFMRIANGLEPIIRKLLKKA